MLALNSVTNHNSYFDMHMHACISEMPCYYPEGSRCSILVFLLQLLDTVNHNQLQQVKALQDRKSAPNTSAKPVAPQTACSYCN